MPTVENAGATIYYEVRGSGPTVVFAHGAGGNAAIWWQQVPFFLDRGYRVVAFDHRGFARSACSNEAMDLGHFPADLLAILDAEGIDRAALVCQSMGGWTGLPTALRHPDRVRCLVLCGTPGGLWTPKVEQGFGQVAERVRRTGLTGPRGAALADNFPDLDPGRAFLYEQISSFNQGLPPSLMGKIQSARTGPDELQGYRVPTLVIAGSKDVLFAPETLREVADAIPGAEFVEFDGAGHSTYFEQPGRFNATVAEFIGKQP